MLNESEEQDKMDLMQRIAATKQIIEKAIVDIGNGQTIDDLNFTMAKCIADAQALWPQDEDE